MLDTDTDDPLPDTNTDDPPPDTDTDDPLPDTDTDDPPRLITPRRCAARFSVSTKTIDRWAQGGILPPPTVINGRKYHNASVKPRPDAA
jgi:hypothetical protein